MVIRIALGLSLSAAMGLAPIDATIGLVSIDDAVKFTGAALAKGAHATVTADMDSTMSTSTRVAATESKTEMTTKVGFTLNVDVTAEDKEGASEATIKIDRARASFTMNGQAGQESDMPGARTSWHATRKGAEWKYEGEGGKAPDEEVGKLLDDVSSRLLVKAPLAASLDGKTLKIGDKVSVEAAVANKIFVYFGSQNSFRSLELELKSTGKEGDAPVAIFAAKAVAEPAPTDGRKPGPSDTLDMKLEGEIAVSTANLFVLRGSLSGPVSMSMKLGKGDDVIAVNGSGQLNWKYGVAVR